MKIPNHFSLLFLQPFIQVGLTADSQKVKSLACKTVCIKIYYAYLCFYVEITLWYFHVREYFRMLWHIAYMISICSLSCFEILCRVEPSVK